MTESLTLLYILSSYIHTVLLTALCLQEIVSKGYAQAFWTAYREIIRKKLGLKVVEEVRSVTCMQHLVHLCIVLLLLAFWYLRSRIQATVMRIHALSSSLLRSFNHLFSFLSRLHSFSCTICPPLPCPTLPRYMVWCDGEQNSPNMKLWTDLERLMAV